MKLVLKKITLFALFVVFSLVLVNSVDAYVNVKGYTKKDGTYVAPYVRSNPNGLKSDNYGYTPSQGTYNKTYGTRGSSWDTSTSITDPYYYQGKSIYESGNNTYYYSSYNNYNSSYQTTPTTPTCPTNSYYDGISSCKCNYGYVVSGASCVSANNICYAQLGYSSSYDSISNTCKCNSGYVIGKSNQCVSANSYCFDQIGLMSQYNSLTNKCECMYGYEFNGSSCVYKTKNYSNYSTGSYRCPTNSHISPDDSSSCQCDSGYQVNSTKTACVIVSYTQPTYTPQPQNDEVVGKNYYLANRTCVGLSGKQFGECISYAYNH